MRYSRRGLITASLLAFAACSDRSITNASRLDSARLRVEASAIASNVALLVLEVTAPDIASPLVFNFDTRAGVVSASITVPVGPNRMLVLRAFDANGLETHRGSATVNVVPGLNPAVTLRLEPLTGEQAIDVQLGSLLVIVNPTDVTLAPGQSTQLTARIVDADGADVAGQVQWATLDPGKASVSTSGLVAAKDTGLAVIVATYAGFGASAQVHVTSAGTPTVGSITVAPPANTIAVAGTVQLSATVLSTSGDVMPGEPVAWESNAPAVASVSGTGLVLGLTPGTATIVARHSSGVSGSATVTVQLIAPPPPSVAELPRVLLDTRYVPPTGGTTRVVHAGDNLQTVLNAAQPGDILTLEAGASFTGNFVLPAKTGDAWIVIRSAAPDASLPAEGQRMSPSYASVLPKLLSPNTDGALKTAPGAHHYRLVGVEIGGAPGVTSNFGLVLLGDGSGAQATAAQVPHDLVLDRVYIHGNSALQVRRCVALNSGATAIIDSYLGECHQNGNDSQAIWGWNGPGPFKIVNNYLAGGHEGLGFGGADPSIAGLVPSDIEIRHNYVTRPLSWKGVWTAKNLMEFKNAQRALIEGNVFENSWEDAQQGWAIVWWSVNQEGGCRWCVTQDLTFRYNRINNVAGGFQLSAAFDGTTAPMQRVVITHNLLTNVGAAGLGSNGRVYQINGAIQDLQIEQNTGFGPGNTVIFVAQPAVVAPRLVIRNNIGGAADRDMADNVYGPYGAGTTALTQYGGSGVVFAGNVIVGGVTGAPANNFYPASTSAVGFLNLLGGDYHLAPTSPYKGKATTGGDPGADIDAVTAATAGVAIP
jgi:hypothetical protein